MYSHTVLSVEGCEKAKTMSRKRKVKEEEKEKVVEKKIKVEIVEDYCYSCQKHGHILSEKCVVRAVCLKCGIKGHVRRDCEAERSAFKEKIMAEIKTKLKDEIKSDVKNEIKEEIKAEDESEIKMEIKSDVKSKIKEEIKTEFKTEIKIEIKSDIKSEIKEEIKSEVKSEIKIVIKSEVKSEIKDEIRSEVTEENEYIEQEITKDEPDSDEQSESENEYIEKEDDDLKKVKVEMYCILCQTHGHAFSKACVVNAICIACGVKGHVMRECFMYDGVSREEYFMYDAWRELLEKCTPQFCAVCQQTFESKPISETHYAGKPHQKLQQKILKVIRRKWRNLGKRLVANTSEENVGNDEQNEMNLKSMHTVKKCTTPTAPIISPIPVAPSPPTDQTPLDGVSHERVSEEGLKESWKCELLKKCTPNFCVVCQETFESKAISEAHYADKPHQKLLQMKLNFIMRTFESKAISKAQYGHTKAHLAHENPFETKAIAEVHYAGKPHQKLLKWRLFPNTSEENVGNNEQNEMNLESMHTVKKCTTPTDKHPVQLLNELSDKAVQYEMVAKVGEGTRALFVMECKINDKTFKGRGKRKKEAKKDCALKVLAEVHQIMYPK